jgi:AraC-like DNA-binding protein
MSRTGRSSDFMDPYIYQYSYENQFYITHTDDPKAPAEYPVHIHDLYEIYYFLSGDVTYFIEGQSYTLSKHDLLVINTGELHKPVFNSSGPYERITIHFRPEYISSFQQKDYNLLYCFERRKLGHHNRLDGTEIIANQVDQYFGSIKKYAIDKIRGSDLMIKTYFLQMLMALNQIFSEKRTNPDNAMSYDVKIVEILDYINTHLHEQITLDSLEERFYVSKYHLCHLFRKNTGVTVGEYIAYKRILKAKEMLISGTPVLETCHAVGFRDYSNFYKTFRRLEGISPREYKQ